MKIEPKYVDGEPWCDEENCNHSYIQDVDCKYMCRYQSPGHLPLDDFSTPCIPALRRDRDQAIKERDAALAREKVLQREICKIGSRLEPCTKEDYAKSRGWPGLFEGGE